jgi:transcriptional regulator with XRE-family HTH domain
VNNYWRLARGLADARWRAGESLRNVATATGVALSTATAVEQGSVWPRWGTLMKLAEHFDARLTRAGETDIPAALVKAIEVKPGLSVRAVAAELGVRPNTLYELKEVTADPSSATVLALAAAGGAPVHLSFPRA